MSKQYSSKIHLIFINIKLNNNIDIHVDVYNLIRFKFENYLNDFIFSRNLLFIIFNITY